MVEEGVLELLCDGDISLSNDPKLRRNITIAINNILGTGIVQGVRVRVREKERERQRRFK